MTLLDDALALLPGGRPVGPANLDRLIEQLGVEVRYRRNRIAFDGCTDLEREIPLIELAWTRRTDSPSLLPWMDGEALGASLPHQYDARTRFTLAHEFGHVLLHRLNEQRPLPRTMTPTNTESLCDAIGAELLMPAAWFTEQLGPEARLGRLRRASIRAGTSISSTVVRARGLGYRIAALHLTRASGCEWRVSRAFGFGPRSALRVPNLTEVTLSHLPMGSVALTGLEINCGHHEHSVAAEVRRTLGSAIVIAHRIDGAAPKSGGSWRCPNRLMADGSG